jgi:hypothetical protein
MFTPTRPTHRSHILLYAALHVGWGVAYTGAGHYFQSQSKLLSPVALIDQRHMYGPRHTYVHQMCTARLPAASVCGSHTNHSPSRPVVNRRSLNLYITPFFEADRVVRPQLISLIGDTR